ncbi:YceI family protein [Pedobacter flavus]|uniref:YceI family protein n=1 Tax=Pedobacter flavus TaxID=3113906 RepID=A0ABU7GYE8_9SPHI|nr:YceI family protein [Pedobacter sp. VNH31]MEE1884031.1 YceI family protein [Pedobacter sp. VNH31]
MKSTLLTSALSIAFIALTAFNTPKVKPESYSVDTKKSNITWFGKKFSGSHKGTVAIKSGSLTFDNKKLINGTFVADMNSIKDDDGSKNLENHLKSDDFFGAQKFPNASFTVKKVAGSGANLNITGDLTIKGITQSITFPAKISWNSDGSATAKVEKIVIDRTKYDIKYKSKSLFGDLGDNFIYDEFEFGVNLVVVKSAGTAK